MKRRVNRLKLGSVLLLGAALGLGCNTNQIAGGSCTADDPNCVLDPNNPNNPYPGAEYSGLVVSPTQVTLDAVDGQPATKEFSVSGQKPDGSVVGPLPARWGTDPNPIGSIDPETGVFTANGEVGGTVTVYVEVTSNGVPIRTTFQLTVAVKKSFVAPGAPADAATKFTGTPVTDVSKSAQVVYPLDGVVMPQNVYPVDIQWSVGNAGDLYRVRITKPNFDFTGYVMHTGAGFKNDWLVDAAAWRGVSQTGGGTSTATLVVDRYDAAAKVVYAGTPINMSFADGVLLGSVYYWDIAAGRIVRINDGSATRTSIMPTPPPAPVNGERCIGCHTVSRDGRYMVGRLGGGLNGATVFDLTKDLSGANPPTEFAASSSEMWFFASWAPDNSRLVVSGDRGTPMRFFDPKTGKTVPTAAGTLPNNATYPAWSPDGKTIAYSGDANSWGDFVSSANLYLQPVTGVDSVGAPKLLHKGTDLMANKPAGTADGYPTWSPDSKSIVFHNGTSLRSENGDGALYIIPAAGGAAVRLNKANGGPNTTDNYIPNFSPFHVGGYHWLMFLSKRDYGNALAGTKARPANLKQQLWVAAIKDTPVPGEDPSCVPYWLPGQDTQSANIAAYWAPRACRKDADSCSVGGECCSGICSGGKCAPPPADQCRTGGQFCGGSGCCSGYECSNNVCSRIVG